MVLAEQLMLVMFGGLAANIFGEIDGFNQKGVILWESLNDVKDEWIEGVVTITVDVVDGCRDDELSIEHVNCNFKLLKRW